MTPAYAIERLSPADAPGIVEPILRSVPEWFGIESATRGYIEASARLPTWAARLRDSAEVIGFITLERHFPAAAEIHCIAVAKASHGRGAGTALVQFAEDHLRADGAHYLQVKTLGPSRECAEYARTRRFYERCGFAPLQEIRGLWGERNPCLIMVKRL